MRRSLIITLLIFIEAVNYATAQNFQPFKNKYQYQFTYTGYIKNVINHELIHGIEIDSAKIVGSDSIFYFNRLSTDTYNQTFKDNFWGNSMVKKSGGEYLFLVTNTTQNDTVIIKTQVSLGTQWTFRLNNIMYTVHYDNYKQETILKNQTDFVKTFIVENASGFKDSIKLSENFGLIYSFPFTDDFSPHHDHFNLTYILNTKIGDNKINYFEYFNYELGDVLEYTPDYRVAAGYPDKTGVDVYKVISKTISLNTDTIKYNFSVCHIDAINGKSYSTTQSHCVLVVTNFSVKGNIPYIDVLSFPTNKYGRFYAYAPGLHNNNLLIAPPYVFEYFPEYSLVKGRGLTNYTFNGGMDYDFIYYINCGYLKQTNLDDDCNGLETILDTKTLHASSSNLVIAPNPFDNVISLNATDLNQGNWNVRITSALGVEVYSSKMVVSSSDQKIDLSNLPALSPGIYFLSLENESSIYSQKIVKQ